MQMCARCHKRVAVVFITRLENGETKNDGICLKCAKELGIKPIDDILKKMGISSEEFDRMSEDAEEFMQGIVPSEDSDELSADDGGAPAVDFGKILRESGLGGNGAANSKNAKDGKKEQKKKFLDTYCQNITQKARDGKLDKIIGREREMARVIQILCRRQKNNPCLIGEPGVGKTAIAEALAQKIASGDVPYKLKGCEIYLVDLTALVAGTQFRGQFESRILGLIKEVKEAGNIILVIDEVHNIVGAGDAEGSMNAANILKPALSRGEIRVIGATTLKEYRKHIEKDSALERRFQPVIVNEPSVADSVKMLEGIKHYYEQYHNIRIPESILSLAVTLSERYITDRYLPDKAIDLLDEAASYRALSSSELNERMVLDDELKAVAKERAMAESAPEQEMDDMQEKYRLLADIRVREARVNERIAEITPACEAVELTAEDLARVIEIWTGVPATEITENEFFRIDRLADRLKEKIIGQDEAVDAVARAIKRNRAGVSYKRKPVSFIFAGPTGVGKTELVKTLANDLFSSPETLIRLDMSEFMEKHSVSKIIGSPPGYVGYDDAGQLTEKIRRRPYSVVLFDEIEKAHPDVLNILLQVLDDGRITDAHGKEVNFENTVIVMTTNAGSDVSSSVSGFLTKEGSAAGEKTEKALLSFLRPEFINRVDEVITFRSLDKHDFSRIAKIMLSQLGEALLAKGISLTYTDVAAEFIADKSYSVKFGARNMRRFIQTNVEDALAEKIISNYNVRVSTARIDSDGEKLLIDIM
ncbi:MAG: ATP-dependent Clp protease ATP-binding subunit [Ruminococcaceae bacterium]|nr:ATP-dependent Clp protease ATP-binding subunit [Oscillospiraceae bacterium]